MLAPVTDSRFHIARNARRLAKLLCFLASAVHVTAAVANEAAAEGAEKAGRYAEALTQYTAALQSTAPGSDAEYRLLERAAAIAPKLRSSPPLPDEAERRFVRGQAIVKGAKDTEAFLRAAQEFRSAVRAAPWLSDAYFNLGVVLDKAERHSEAIRALKLYVLAAPNPKDAKDAQRLIYEIEVRLEDVQRAKSKDAAERSARVEADRQEQQRRAALIQRLAGEWVLDTGNWYRFRLTVSGNQFEMVMTAADYRGGRGWQPVYYRIAYSGSADGMSVSGNWEQEWTHDRTVSGRGTGSFRRGTFSGTISADGNRIDMVPSSGAPLTFQRI